MIDMFNINKVLVIANSKSGSFDETLFNKVVGVLREKFHNIEIRYTEFAGHAEIIASETDAELVVPAGGDGLLNEVINGLYAHKCLLFPLSFGTANVFCREHGIPLDPLKAVSLTDFSSDKRLFVGRISGRYFLQMLGFGFDADTVRRVDLQVKKKVGKIAYLLSGFSVLKANNFKRFSFFCNSKTYNAYHLIVSLGKFYAGGFKLFRDFRYGYFGINFINSPTRFSVFRSFVYLFFGLGFSGRKLFTDKLKISGAKYCQMDGELFCLESESNFITLHKTDIYIIS